MPIYTFLSKYHCNILLHMKRGKCIHYLFFIFLNDKCSFLIQSLVRTEINVNYHILGLIFNNTNRRICIQRRNTKVIRCIPLTVMKKSSVGVVKYYIIQER